jgi:hypothetical protein
MEERARGCKGVTLLDIVGGSGRNCPCICKSGRKLKRCCGLREVVLNETCRHGDHIVAFASVVGDNRLLIMSQCQECAGQLVARVRRDLGGGVRRAMLIYRRNLTWAEETVKD